MSLKSRILALGTMFAMVSGNIGNAFGETNIKAKSKYYPEEVKAMREEEERNHIKSLQRQGCKYFTIPTENGNVRILALNLKNAYRKAGVITRKEMKRFNHYSFQASLS